MGCSQRVLVAALTACSGTDNDRVCMNDPDASTVLTYTVSPSSNHIVSWFSISDPEAAALRQWGLEGASSED